MAVVWGIFKESSDMEGSVIPIVEVPAGNPVLRNCVFANHGNWRVLGSAVDLSFLPT